VRHRDPPPSWHRLSAAHAPRRAEPASRALLTTSGVDGVGGRVGVAGRRRGNQSTLGAGSAGRGRRRRRPHGVRHLRSHVRHLLVNAVVLRAARRHGRRRLPVCPKPLPVCRRTCSVNFVFVQRRFPIYFAYVRVAVHFPVYLKRLLVCFKTTSGFLTHYHHLYSINFRFVQKQYPVRFISCFVLHLLFVLLLPFRRVAIFLSLCPQRFPVCSGCRRGRRRLPLSPNPPFFSSSRHIRQQHIAVFVGGQPIP